MSIHVLFHSSAHGCSQYPGKDNVIVTFGNRDLPDSRQGNSEFLKYIILWYLKNCAYIEFTIINNIQQK